MLACTFLVCLPDYFWLVVILEQRGENNRQYTSFSNPASAVDRIDLDSIGPSQRLAVAIHRVGGRIINRDNTVTGL